jgi:hypothetical protein
MLFEQGQLEKMTLRVIEYADGSRPEVSEDKSYTVQVNPASYTIGKRIQYQNQRPPGSQEGTATFDNSGPSTLQFEIVFDGTGVVKNASSLDEIPLVGAIASAFGEDEEFSVYEQIVKFEKIVYRLDGENHQPNKVQIFWGSLQFEGALTSINYTYSLFQPDGMPLRAKANVSFQGTKTAEQIALEENLASPDLTHLREIKEGDTLPLLAQKVYGNPNLYLEVARVNKLINFRRLQAGKRISLPPIDKSAGGKR